MLHQNFKLKENFHNKRGRIQTGYKEKGFFFTIRIVKALKVVVQRYGGCPIPGDTQGKARPVSDVAVDVPVCCRGTGLDDL